MTYSADSSTNTPGQHDGQVYALHALFYVLALQGLAALPAIASARPYILVTQLHAWHGPFKRPTDWGLIGHAVWVSALYAVPPLVAAWILFRQRDVAT